MQNSLSLYRNILKLETRIRRLELNSQPVDFKKEFNNLIKTVKSPLFPRWFAYGALVAIAEILLFSFIWWLS